MTFEESGLDPKVLTAVEELGFETLTPIQEKCIPHLLTSDRDLIGLAQTGTGKTAAFGLPIVSRADANAKGVQAIILCPTRELCLQITSDLESFAKNLKLAILAVYGGSSIQTQIRDLRKGVQIVVGTPGRVLDLIGRKQLKLDTVRWLVLDEADEMLNMGFKEDLDQILSATPAEKQTLLFSATMPDRIGDIAETYLTAPIEFSVSTKNKAAENVAHHYYVIDNRDRYRALKRLIDFYPDFYGIVFARTRRDTQLLAEKLIQDNYSADALHGDLSQILRDKVMNRFRQRNLQILVATDVAARGVDVEDLTHVINFALPDDPEVYIHRSGRTGRAGKTGASLMLLTKKELFRIKRLEKIAGKRFTLQHIPGGQEITEKQLFSILENIAAVEVDEESIAPYLPTIYEQFAEMDKEEVIRHFVSHAFNQVLARYQKAPDLNRAVEQKKSETRPGKKKVGNNPFVGFYINLGSKASLTAGKLIMLINEHTDNRDIRIGRIKILKKVSYFEIASGYEEEVQEAFANAKFNGQKVIVQVAADPPKYKVSGGSYGGKKKKKWKR